MKKALLLFAAAASLVACNQSQKQEKKAKAEWKQFDVKYPETKKVDTVDEYFGVKVKDPYRWLENDTAKDTEAWVEKQNEVTFGYLDKIPYRDSIKSRYTELMNYPKVSAPRKVGDYFFIYKNDGLQDQSVIYYKKGKDGEEKVFMDPNKMSEDGTVTVSLMGASDDDRYMAYRYSEAGSDWGEIRVRDIEKNEDTGDILKWVKFSGAAWYKDGFYYSRYPAPKDGLELSAKNTFHQVYYHKLGTSQDKDKLIYANKENPKLYHNISVTEDDEYLILNVSEGTENNDIYFRKTANEGGEFKPLIDGFKAKSSVTDHKDGKFYVVTDLNAPNNRFVAIDVNNVDEAGWENILDESESKLNGVSKGGGYLFAQYMENATDKVYRMNYDGSDRVEVKLPGTGSAGGFYAKKEEDKLYYTFTSFTYPNTIFEYNIEKNESKEYYRPELKFNPEDYVEKQIWYKSKDGTDVSMFIVHKKGIELDGTHPTMLYGYGGFNISLTPSFSTSNIILLENGGVYAMANLRGGGEYGEKWHKEGMLMKKQNVFDDFIAAGEYLIKEGYTTKDKLAIAGGSNGGLLVGASMTQRPDLFKVAFPAVGVMDMLRYHKFTVGWGWVPEYGSSEQSKEMFEYLKGYSPLHNLKKGTDYPATMVTTADHDDRVVPAHSFKFAATLQEKHAGTDPVLIRIAVRAGHGAGKPISKIIEEQADKWSFMFWNMEYADLPGAE
ncbi:prolyl oligopeptidase family serine peptidase [Salibacter sp.]|uniref:prolyl oligopeptidase family serine peptidase n=1 Tax=Salibacter sp. TaxID=2010995 RepID=UPI00286FB11B|nr:prolyl oligopeptidase family serine peptidase [Salibacter sp.]MDR9398223.1 prolyl oligopeptidase family serine peptidase [Salibacter sp.]MDR9487473.1 prolyl oligopeptidase family serine peptidase [Salibacter sp.]